MSTSNNLPHIMSSTRSNARHEPSKLPAFLIEPYQRYKRNTDKLASWLGRTAESLGYSQLTKPSPAAAQPNPKSVRQRKGKVRAPQAADQVPSSASGSNPQSQSAADGSRPPKAVTTYFSTADFVTLAKFIASSSNPSATVPPRVLDWAKRAICARRQCGEWFKLNTRPGSASAAARVGVRDDGNLMERSNKSHAHFIAILEEVVCIFEKRVCRRTVRGALAKVDSVLELNAGRYSPLADDSAHASTRDDTAEEELEDDWDVVNEMGLAAFTHTHTTRSHKSRAPNPKLNTSPASRRIYHIQDDDPMAFINAYSTHLTNMLHVTRFVTHMWNDHFVHNLPSQQVAGLATTAAVDKIQAEHAEICVAYPDYMANEFAYSDLLFSMTALHAQRTDLLRAKAFQGDRIEDYQSAIRETAVKRAMFVMTSATCLGEQVVAASLRRAFKRSNFKDCAFGPADVADPPHIANASQEVAAWMTTNMEELVRDMEALRCLYYAWQEVEHILYVFLFPPLLVYHLV
ncbi:hypothetical protein BCR44DRAFT_1228722 [Catenaria anguillulae PL171]|uniref:DUF6604 domain-containing protein n=1 Tax=Catenaria anguillulae PL171 TaxID=765915 RepID=A0A1Y2HDV4_9FUNG|nr:hypothetical protein BCR44DRAFT_1228722 [Catenaria anguillulae PL171]